MRNERNLGEWANILGCFLQKDGEKSLELMVPSIAASRRVGRDDQCPKAGLSISLISEGRNENAELSLEGQYRRERNPKERRGSRAGTE